MPKKMTRQAGAAIRSVRAFLAGLPTPAYVIAVLILTAAILFARNGDSVARGLTTAFLPTERETAVKVEAAVAMALPTVAEETSIYEKGLPDLQRLEPLPPEEIDTETLWLARCIYSETKRPEEQELVAWVVRNRVESGYRGKKTYQSVVLDRYQFSAFNGGRTRRFYTGLTPKSTSPGWQTALAIAEAVRYAPAEARPFPLETRHFYSQQSMRGRRHPGWARGKSPAQPKRTFSLDAQRFRFVPGVR